MSTGGCTARVLPDDLEFDTNATGRPDPDIGDPTGRPEPVPPDTGDPDDGFDDDGFDDDGFDDGFDDGWMPDLYDPPPIIEYQGQWIIVLRSMVVPGDSYHYGDFFPYGGGGEYEARVGSLSQAAPPPGAYTPVGDSTEGFGFGDADYFFVEFGDLEVPAAAVPGGIGDVVIGDMLFEMKPASSDVMCGRAYGSIAEPVNIEVGGPAGMIRRENLDAWDTMYALCL